MSALRVSLMCLVSTISIGLNGQVAGMARTIDDKSFNPAVVMWYAVPAARW